MTNINGKTATGKNGKYPGTIPDRLQPHNTDAEQAFLGSVLIDADAIIRAASVGLVDTDFYIERHGWIWQAITDLYEQQAPVDMVSLTDELERRGQLGKIGGSAYLAELMTVTPSGIWGTHYAQIIKRTSVLRQLIGVAGHISRLAYSDDLEADEAVQQAMDLLLDVSKNNVQRKSRTLAETAQLVLDRIEQVQNSENGISGLPTGLTDLDRLTGGLQKSDLIILAGRPAMGKSALALQIALDAAKRYKARTLIFSREMSDEALFQRMIASESGIDVQRIRQGKIKADEYDTLLTTTDRLTRLPVIIDCHTSTPEALRARAILEQEKHGLDLVIVDYLQRVDPPGSRKYHNKAAEVGAVSSMLKSLAIDLNVPVLAISSLSRQCEMRADKRPMLSDLRESGDIEYDADVVIFAYRDEVYNADTDYPNVAELIISKQRQGTLGVVSAYFKKHLTKFIDLEVRVQPMDWVK